MLLFNCSPHMSTSTPTLYIHSWLLKHPWPQGWFSRPLSSPSATGFALDPHRARASGKLQLGKIRQTIFKTHAALSFFLSLRHDQIYYKPVPRGESNPRKAVATLAWLLAPNRGPAMHPEKTPHAHIKQQYEQLCHRVAMPTRHRTPRARLCSAAPHTANTPPLMVCNVYFCGGGDVVDSTRAFPTECSNDNNNNCHPIRHANFLNASQTASYGKRGISPPLAGGGGGANLTEKKKALPSSHDKQNRTKNPSVCRQTYTPSTTTVPGIILYLVQ